MVKTNYKEVNLPRDTLKRQNRQRQQTSCLEEKLAQDRDLNDTPRVLFDVCMSAVEADQMSRYPTMTAWTLCIFTNENWVKCEIGIRNIKYDEMWNEV